MGVVSEKYIDGLIKNYLKTARGKELVRQFKKEVFEGKRQGPENMLTSKKVATYSYEAKNILYDAIVSVIASFSKSYDQIAVDFNTEKAGIIQTDISVSESALRRESLHYMSKNDFDNTGNLTIFHGSGIDDILALFTFGYSIKNRPYGFWVHADGVSEERIGAKMHRDPNGFLQDAVNTINEKYSGILTATLNEKYIR